MSAEVLMRRVALLSVMGLLVWACAGGETTTSTRTADTATSAVPATSATSAPTAPTPTTSTRPTTTTGPTTTTTAQPTPSASLAIPALVLRGDGLGALDFGTPTGPAMETLGELLGPNSPGDEYPYGGHPLRHVYWDDIGLAVVFSEYEFYRDDGLEHLAGWGHGPKPTGESTTPTPSWVLKTAEGIGIGSTLAEVQDAYGERVVVEAAPCDGPPTVAYLTATPTDDRGIRLFFYFDRETSDRAARIVALGAGAGPGC